MDVFHVWIKTFHNGKEEKKMKAQTKALVASVVVVALALSAVSGITYSWFSNSDTADVDVTTGTVDIKLSNLSVKTYSWNESDYEEQSNGSFLNGGSATVDASGNIEIKGMADRDRVVIYGDVTNNSTIKTIWRITLKEVDENGDAVQTNSQLFTALLNGKATSTSWSNAAIPSDSTTGDKLIEDGSLFTIELNNYSTTGETCHMKIIAEAFQSNADVDKNVNQTTVMGMNTITLNSTDSSSKLRTATIQVKITKLENVGLLLNTSEVDLDSVQGIVNSVAGIDLVSGNETDLFKGEDVTITFVLDGIYADGQIGVYHGNESFNTGTTGNSFTVSSNETENTTTVEIKTVDGFSAYVLNVKQIQLTKNVSSGTGKGTYYSFYDDISSALNDATLADNTTYVMTILKDLSFSTVQSIDVDKSITIAGYSKDITLENVRFNITGNSPVVMIKDLTMIFTFEQSTGQSHHIIAMDQAKGNANLNLSNLDFMVNADSKVTSAPVYVSNSGQLTINKCTFSLGVDVEKSVKRHAIELKSLSNVNIMNCVFNDFSRPINLEKVSSTIAGNNTFVMPGVADSVSGYGGLELNNLLKIYNITNGIRSFSVSGDSITWNGGDGVEKAPVYINKNVVVEGLFSSDLDVHLKNDATDGKLTINQIAKIDANVIVPSDATVILGLNGELTCNSISKDPVCIDSSKTPVKDGQTWSVSTSTNLDVSGENTIAGLIDDLENKTGSYVLGEGEASLGNAEGLTAKIIGAGADKTTIDMVNKMTKADNLVFENLKFEVGTEDFVGIQHSDSIIFRNCTIEGKMFLYANTVIFENCTFVQKNQDYNIWTYGAKNVIIEDCTFNTLGKSILLYGYGPTNLLVKNCTFNDSGSSSAGKAAIEIGNDYNATYNLVIENMTVNGFADGKNTGSKLWANKNSMDADHLSVTIDGTKVQ